MFALEAHSSGVGAADRFLGFHLVVDASRFALGTRSMVALLWLLSLFLFSSSSSSESDRRDVALDETVEERGRIHF